MRRILPWLCATVLSCGDSAPLTVDGGPTIVDAARAVDAAGPRTSDAPAQPPVDGGLVSGAIRVACVGDSITMGLGASDQGTESYPAQLQALLGSGYHVENDGQSNATVSPTSTNPYSGSALYQRAHDFLPDIVIITLGTNDMNAFAFGENDRFVVNYTNMIDSFVSLSSQPKIFVGVPVWVSVDDVQAQYTEARLQSVIIPEVMTVAHDVGAMLIDFHAVTLNHPEDYYPPAPIHPNDAGYALMAAAAASAIRP